MNRPFVVGLTGQTGAGKSEVARVFAENGCTVIDADVLARRAVEVGSPCLQQLTERFSKDILFEDGSLNRAALAALAFADEESTAALNAIVHPAVIRMTQKELEIAAEQKRSIVVIDAPLLFQAGMGAICDCTVVVTAPRDVRLKRICVRDSLTKEQALHRMNAQPNEQYYTERATVLLHNAGDRAALRGAAEQLLQQIGAWRDER